MAALLALLGSISFGVADFFGGMSARRIEPTITATASQLSGLVVLFFMALVVGGTLSAEDLALGISAGLVGAGALFLFYRGLALGAMSVVAPISAVTAAIVPIVVGVFIGEAPEAVQWVGILLALPAVVLISREGTADAPEPASPTPAPSAQAPTAQAPTAQTPTAQTPTVPLEERATPANNRAGIIAGLLAGAGFGTFITLITRTSEASGLWPLVISRSTAGPIMLAVLLVGGLWRRVERGSGLNLAMAAGAIDASSNVLVLVAGRRGLLVLVGVISALYPASTVVLARVVLGERLQRHQVMGLLLAVVALVLVTV